MSVMSLPPDILSFTVFVLSYHIFSFVFHVFDKFSLFSSHKHFLPLQNSPSYSQMLLRVLMNQFFILLPSMHLTTLLSLSYNPQIPPPPPLKSFLSLLTLAPLLHEITFYVFHRFLLHTPFGLIRLNHALHHSTKTHSAVSAMYMSPLDFCFEIVTPYLVPLVLLSSFGLCGPNACIAMLPLGALGGLYEHSGYNFFSNVMLLDTSFHAMHHRLWDCSFADGVGAMNFLDWGMGTCCGTVGKWVGRDTKD